MPVITDGDVRKGFFRERKILAHLLQEEEEPYFIKQYAKRISGITKVPYETVLKSRPTQKFKRKMLYGEEKNHIDKS